MEAGKHETFHPEHSPQKSRAGDGWASCCWPFVLGYALRNVTSGVQAKPDNRPLLETSNKGESDQRTVYVCSMNCVPPMDQPGNCPVCGMELLPMLLGGRGRAGYAETGADRGGCDTCGIADPSRRAEVRFRGSPDVWTDRIRPCAHELRIGLHARCHRSRLRKTGRANRALARPSFRSLLLGSVLHPSRNW